MNSLSNPDAHQLILEIEGFIDGSHVPAPAIYSKEGDLLPETQPIKDLDLKGSLLIHSGGGRRDHGEVILSSLRQVCNQGLTAYIPHKAGSMAAVIAMSADQIVVRGKTNLHFHACVHKTLRSVEIPNLSPNWMVSDGKPLTGILVRDRVKEEDLEEHLEWSRDFIAHAPQRLRKDLTERLRKGEATDLQAGFDISGRELSQMDFGKEREVILCNGGIPEMTSAFSKSVGEAVARQSRSAQFWDKAQKNSLRD